MRVNFQPTEARVPTPEQLLAGPADRILEPSAIFVGMALRVAIESHKTVREIVPVHVPSDEGGFTAHVPRSHNVAWTQVHHGVVMRPFPTPEETAATEPPAADVMYLKMNDGNERQLSPGDLLTHIVYPAPEPVD